MFKFLKQNFTSVFGGSRKLLWRAIGRLKGLKTLDESVLKELEKALIEADVGLQMTQKIITALSHEFSAGIQHEDDVVKFLKQYLINALGSANAKLSSEKNVIMMIGVNGVGKTTTIGKLAHYFRTQRRSVGVVPADTYRAAAYEQLDHWAQQTQSKMYYQPGVKDPSAMIYDAMQQSDSEVLIVDTAGRMHGQHNLMDQLKKMKRVMRKLDENAPHQLWLVLDGSLGQNSITQAKVFHEELELTGLIVTKLDGSAKGGALFEIVQALQLPIEFVGLGEGIEDLQPFDATAYVEQLLHE
ncbi:signal recognition particle-docking protein FtsY [Gammaproteobacteria bacterium]|nr:signal recognition particle-docking protein FtsY [Gammaproteobacteria bacterium]